MVGDEAEVMAQPEVPGSTTTYVMAPFPEVVAAEKVFEPAVANKAVVGPHVTVWVPEEIVKT